MSLEIVRADHQAALAQVAATEEAIRADEVSLAEFDRNPPKDGDAEWIRVRRREEVVQHLAALTARLGEAREAVALAGERIAIAERAEAARGRYEALGPSLLASIDFILANLDDAGNATADEHLAIAELNRSKGLSTWEDGRFLAATPGLGPAERANARQSLHRLRALLSTTGAGRATDVAA